jgi:hypothetical protein
MACGLGLIRGENMAVFFVGSDYRLSGLTDNRFSSTKKSCL